MITIIDYGAGNIKSIKNMLKKLRVNSLISSDAEEINNATKLILPGVGNFDFGMRNLNESGLKSQIERKVMEDKVPILGICLGAQLLGKSSEEGIENGLGWIDMEVKRFKFESESNLKVPHMGWNNIEISKDSLLMKDLMLDSRFYFVHSFYMYTANKEDTLSTTRYGIEFTSAVEKENIYGVQFHPEKSHKYGMQILDNFVKI